MKIIKTRDVKTPTRGTEGSAGIDFYVPEKVDENAPGNGNYYDLRPGQHVNIPSGIKAKVPENYALVAFNKSGRAIQGLQVGACVVDSDYQGEIHLHVRNAGQNHVIIRPGDKLVQFLLLPVSHEGVEVVKTEEELYSKKTVRGESGFGSTGNN